MASWVQGSVERGFTVIIDRDNQMILEILAHTGKVSHDRNPEASK